MTEVAIDCRGLSKRYGHSEDYALKELTLSVRPGEIYGFLGPNGAGKSTTIRTLLNFIQPSGGRAHIMGLDIVQNSVEVKQHVGYLAGEVALYQRATGRQFLDYMAALQPLKDPAYQQELIAQFHAELDKPLHTLSKGNRQKIGLLQALMHQPEVIILDEPTSGLDPLMQAVFYDVIQAAKQRGAAVFLSSHDLAEVRKMCDRIGFIRGGQLVSEQTIADLQATAAHSFNITFAGSIPRVALAKLQGASINSMTGQHVSLRWQGDLRPLFSFLAKHEVLAFDKHDVDLEEAFLDLYQETSA